jgi:hypothetical protein
MTETRRSASSVLAIIALAIFLGIVAAATSSTSSSGVGESTSRQITGGPTLLAQVDFVWPGAPTSSQAATVVS